MDYKDIPDSDKIKILEAEIELIKMQMISDSEAHIIRQWFDHIEDTSTPDFPIETDDYEVAAKIYKICGRKLRGSIKRGRL